MWKHRVMVLSIMIGLDLDSLHRSGALFSRLVANFINGSCHTKWYGYYLKLYLFSRFFLEVVIAWRWQTFSPYIDFGLSSGRKQNKALWVVRVDALSTYSICCFQIF